MSMTLKWPRRTRDRNTAAAARPVTHTCTCDGSAIRWQSAVQHAGLPASREQRSRAERVAREAEAR